jgi:hypothetical protein
MSALPLFLFGRYSIANFLTVLKSYFTALIKNYKNLIFTAFFGIIIYQRTKRGILIGYDRHAANRNKHLRALR